MCCFCSMSYLLYLDYGCVLLRQVMLVFEPVRLERVDRMDEVAGDGEDNDLVDACGSGEVCALLKLPSLGQLLGLPPGAFFFFFSSRRRHTRFDCDWSSDVCSSD